MKYKVSTIPDDFKLEKKNDKYWLVLSDITFIITEDKFRAMYGAFFQEHYKLESEKRK